MNLVPRRGRIVCWGESDTVRGVVAKAFCPVETYGFGADNDWIAGDLEFTREAHAFSRRAPGRRTRAHATAAWPGGTMC